MITSKGCYISMSEFWFQLGQCNNVYVCVPVEGRPIKLGNTIMLKVAKSDVMKATEGFSADYQVYACLQDSKLVFGFHGCF